MASKTSTKAAAAKSSAPSKSSAEKDTTAPTGEVTPETKPDPLTEQTDTTPGEQGGESNTAPAPVAPKPGDLDASSPQEPVEGVPTGEVTPETKTDAEAPAETAPVIAAEEKGTTNEVAPSPYTEAETSAEGRFDHIETARAQSEIVPSRSQDEKTGVYAIDSDQQPVGSAPTDERVKRDAPSDLPVQDGGLASPAEPKNEAEGFKGAAQMGGGAIMAPGAPLEPPALPTRAESKDEKNAYAPHQVGELGAALIRENRPGSRLRDAATGEAPDPESLFESTSGVGSSLRCTVRLVQTSYQGPSGRPLRQLVMTKGQVVGPEKAKQVVAILKSQIEYDAQDADQSE